ncbi:MAG: histidine triad nucleotide-binding protein [Chloroflexota bacterium]
MTDCLFCKIVLGEIPADIVHQDEDAVAFRDTQPQAPVHVLVVPRKHITGFSDATTGDTALLGAVCAMAARVAQIEGIEKTGYRCVINSGPDANQTVPHLHLHVLGGRRMGWPPG